MRFSLKTFGCKTNQYEAQAMREALAAAGHTEVAGGEVLIVHTCTVTGRADATWRNFIAAARRQNPRLRLILTGCAVNVELNIAERIGAEKIFRNDENCAALVRYFAAPPPSAVNSAAVAKYPAEKPAIAAFAGHTRAFLKIQDGCDNACSYCIIPRARGAARSRPAAEIVAEAARLVANDYREIALTGINIGAYRDGENTLAGLCRALVKIAGLRRLRLGSIEPPAVSDELLLTMRDCPPICRHLHLPLQSGADEILRLMNRRYTLADYFAVLDRARKILATPAITTDLIVGAPGENEDSFATTKNTVARAGFARTHIFLYSPRPGTPLAELPRRDHRRVAERRGELTELCDRAAAAFAASLVGETETVLVEKNGRDADYAEGYGERYLRVRIPRSLPPRSLATVKITRNDGAVLWGKVES
ncbi:MAG: MiaB/RimO family radical SAM methylthiotransferase [Planctomycetota bacterium]|jgi:threonylcarbamoyladenosine tRNA methylthiotransferase MtaB|nr:MiaB/RimO family radical SAM methylthiotransferase [Planctomycetota bacterium]